MNELEREVSTHDAGVEELNREHALQLDALREAKAMLEVEHVEWVWSGEEPGAWMGMHVYIKRGEVLGR